MKIVMTEELLDYLGKLYDESRDLLTYSFEEFVERWLSERCRELN